MTENNNLLPTTLFEKDEEGLLLDEFKYRRGFLSDEMLLRIINVLTLHEIPIKTGLCSIGSSNERNSLYFETSIGNLVIPYGFSQGKAYFYINDVGISHHNPKYTTHYNHEDLERYFHLEYKKFISIGGKLNNEIYWKEKQYLTQIVEKRLTNMIYKFEDTWIGYKINGCEYTVDFSTSPEEDIFYTVRFHEGNLFTSLTRKGFILFHNTHILNLVCSDDFILDEITDIVKAELTNRERHFKKK